MPNLYKGSGNTPAPCLDCPIPPDTGASPSSGPGDEAMASASNPLTPCSPPPPCTSPCCMDGGGGPGGPGGGPGGPGGGPVGGFGGPPPVLGT